MIGFIDVGGNWCNFVLGELVYGVVDYFGFFRKIELESWVRYSYGGGVFCWDWDFIWFWDRCGFD